MKKWKILSSKIAFDEKWLRVRQDKILLPNGKIIDDYFVWDSNDVCMVIPIKKDGKIILEKQYKHALGEIIYGFPSGEIGKNETPKKATLRELGEETGYVAKKIELLGKMSQDSSKKKGTLYLYLARDIESKEEKNFDLLEDIETFEMSYKEIMSLVKNGKIKGSSSLAALFLLKEKFPELCQ